MNSMMALVRLLHIMFGVFWVGTVFFNVLILEPRLAALGPKIQKPVMGQVMPRLIPAMIGSSVVVLATGVVLTLRMRGWSLGPLLSTGWGLTIVIGLVATLGAMAVGFGVLTPTGARLARFDKELGDRPPTQDQVTLLARLGRRMQVLGWVDFALVFVAVATMPLARFI